MRDREKMRKNFSREVRQKERVIKESKSGRFAENKRRRDAGRERQTERENIMKN